MNFRYHVGLAANNNGGEYVGTSSVFAYDASGQLLSTLEVNGAGLIDLSDLNTEEISKIEIQPYEAIRISHFEFSLAE